VIEIRKMRFELVEPEDQAEPVGAYLVGEDELVVTLTKGAPVQAVTPGRLSALFVGLKLTPKLEYGVARVLEALAMMDPN